MRQEIQQAIQLLQDGNGEALEQALALRQKYRLLFQHACGQSEGFKARDKWLGRQIRARSTSYCSRLF
jgi:hypothetical protein